MKLIIFDCDGTLIDSQHSIVAAISDAFTSLGLAVPSRHEVMSIIGLSLPEAFAVLAAQENESDRDELARHYKAAFTKHRAQDSHQERLYPGIKSAVSILSQRDDFHLAIATGKSRPGVARLCNREGWQDVFSSVQTADNNPSKPHPSMIFQALEDTGLQSENTIMIGDTTFDMEMACSAGVGALGVAWGYHPEDALRSAGADHISQTADTLLADIDQMFDV